MRNLEALLPGTRKTLELLAEYRFLEEFTFVEGSALAVYLNHRKSEDLDFFTASATLPQKQILDFLNDKSNDNKLQSMSEQQIDAIINGTRVTFFANNWEALHEREQLTGFAYIAKLDLLSAMKINTLFLRARYRDYYDLYQLVKLQYSIDQLFINASNYFPSVTHRLFEMALVFTTDILDDNIHHLSPSEKISKEKISKFFERKIKEWNKNQGRKS